MCTTASSRTLTTSNKLPAQLTNYALAETLAVRVSNNIPQARKEEAFQACVGGMSALVKEGSWSRNLLAET